MSLVDITLAPPLYAQLLAVQDVVDPSHFDTIWGNGPIRPVQATSHNRVASGPPGWGWTCEYSPHVDGKCQLQDSSCWRIVDADPPGLSVALRAILLAAAGEPPGPPTLVAEREPKT